MLYRTLKQHLTKSWQHSKELGSMLKNGYSLDLNKANMTELEKHMAESARNLIREKEISPSVIKDGMLNLTRDQAIAARYSDSSIKQSQKVLLDDAIKVGSIAAAGVIGLRAAQGAVGLVAGAGDTFGSRSY